MAVTFRSSRRTGSRSAPPTFHALTGPLGRLFIFGRGKPNLRVVDGLSGPDDPEQLPTLIVEED